MIDIKTISPVKQKEASIMKTVTAFDNLKNNYNEFVKKMDKSDVSNSFTRYSTELELLKKLKSVAQENKLTQENEYLAQKELEIKSKLEKLGYIID